MYQLAYVYVEMAHKLGFDFNVIGGPSLGADVIAHSVIYEIQDLHPGERQWMSIRKDKIYGASLNEKSKVLLVDDSVGFDALQLLAAYERIIETGAEIVGVMPLVDACSFDRAKLSPYHAVFNSRDFNG